MSVSKEKTTLIRETYLEGLYESLELETDIAEFRKLNRCDKNDLFVLAVKKNNLKVVGILLELSADVNSRCSMNQPALHHAAVGNFQPMIQLLIDHAVDLNQIDSRYDTALNRIVHTHMDLGCILLLVVNGANIWLTNSDSQCPVTVLLKSVFDDLFWLMVVAHDEGCQILAVMKSPVLFVNRVFKQTHQQRSMVSGFISNMLMNQDPKVVKCLILWHIALEKAAVARVSEQDDLLEYAQQIKRVITQIFQSDSMDELWNIQMVLHPDLEVDRTQPILRYQIHSLRSGGLLDLCLQHSCKFIFEDHHVAGFVSAMFWLSSRVELSNCSFGEGAQHSSVFESVDLAARCLQADVWKNQLVRTSYGLRSCPAACYLSESMTRIAMISLVGRISVAEYGDACGSDFTHSCDISFSRTEYALVLLFLSALLYAVGEMAELKWNIWGYFKDEWNICDFIGHAFIALWCYNRGDNMSVSRVLLSMSAIPMCLGLLRYLNLSRSLGIVVSIARAMLFDMMAFIAVYVVCIFGFGIFFQGSFHDSSSFEDTHQTFLTLFQFTLGTVDYSVFDSSSYKMNYVGETVLVLFLLLTAVLLFNLLISRMTNAYHRVDVRAVEEWSFNKTLTVQKFLMLHERHTFCMMPPPFNLLTTAVKPFHRTYLSSSISVSGTVANVLYGQMGGVMRAMGFCKSFFKPLKGVLYSFFVERRESWKRPIVYFFSNLLIMCLLGLIVIMTAFFPFVVDWWYKPLPCLSFFVEYVKDEVPTYLLLEQQTATGVSKTTRRRSDLDGVELTSMNPIQDLGRESSFSIKRVDAVADVRDASEGALSAEDRVLFTAVDVERIIAPLHKLADDSKQEIAALRDDIATLRKDMADMLAIMMKDKA